MSPFETSTGVRELWFLDLRFVSEAVFNPMIGNSCSFLCAQDVQTRRQLTLQSNRQLSRNRFVPRLKDLWPLQRSKE